MSSETELCGKNRFGPCYTDKVEWLNDSH